MKNHKLVLKLIDSFLVVHKEEQACKLLKISTLLLRETLIQSKEIGKKLELRLPQQQLLLRNDDFVLISSGLFKII